MAFRAHCCCVVGYPEVTPEKQILRAAEKRFAQDDNS
jgi:hypothetical protein